MGDDGEITHNQPIISRFKRVCVFCGSSVGKRNCYREAAVELAGELVGTFRLWLAIYVRSHVG